jgi:hypothetical protein
VHYINEEEQCYLLLHNPRNQGKNNHFNVDFESIETTFFALPKEIRQKIITNVALV